jgi:hypothetical protein
VLDVATRALEGLRHAPFVGKPAPACGTSLHVATADIVTGAIAQEGMV